MCKEKTINRDELCEILHKLEIDFPQKKADYLFLKSNRDGDPNMDASEFIHMYMEEDHQK
jgi:Ca2+-binding EF-hand superfamily protein